MNADPVEPHTHHRPSQLRLLTGYARKTLSVYQHVARDGDREGKYQQAMKMVDL